MLDFFERTAPRFAFRFHVCTGEVAQLAVTPPHADLGTCSEGFGARKDHSNNACSADSSLSPPKITWQKFSQAYTAAKVLAWPAGNFPEGTAGGLVARFLIFIPMQGGQLG